MGARILGLRPSLSIWIHAHIDLFSLNLSFLSSLSLIPKVDEGNLVIACSEDFEECADRKSVV